jgi:hypothetical protein
MEGGKDCCQIFSMADLSVGPTLTSSRESVQVQYNTEASTESSTLNQQVPHPFHTHTHHRAIIEPPTSSINPSTTPSPTSTNTARPYRHADLRAQTHGHTRWSRRG